MKNEWGSTSFLQASNFIEFSLKIQTKYKVSDISVLILIYIYIFFFQLYISWNQNVGCPFVSLQYRVSGGSTIDLTGSSATVSLADLAVGDSVTITGRRNITDNMLLDVDITTTARIYYERALGKD